MLVNNAGFSVKRTYQAEGLDLHHRGIDVMAKAVLISPRPPPAP